VTRLHDPSAGVSWSLAGPADRPRARYLPVHMNTIGDRPELCHHRLANRISLWRRNAERLFRHRTLREPACSTTRMTTMGTSDAASNQNGPRRFAAVLPAERAARVPRRPAIAGSRRVCRRAPPRCPRLTQGRAPTHATRPGRGRAPGAAPASTALGDDGQSSNWSRNFRMIPELSRSAIWASRAGPRWPSRRTRPTGPVATTETTPSRCEPSAGIPRRASCGTRSSASARPACRSRTGCCMACWPRRSTTAGAGRRPDQRDTGKDERRAPPPSTDGYGSRADRPDGLHRPGACGSARSVPLPSRDRRTGPSATPAPRRSGPATRTPASRARAGAARTARLTPPRRGCR
jgi:hypothetical protein